MASRTEMQSEGKKHSHSTKEECTDADYSKYEEDRKCGKILDGYGIYHILKDAVVVVETVTFINIGMIRIPIYSVSSGFFCDKDYNIAVAAHSIINFLSPTPTRVNQVYVRVFNVNGSGENPFYKAAIVGADYALDVAVLRINHSESQNSKLPKITDHPWIKSGNSRKYSPGRSSYIIGSSLGQYYQGITDGVVRDNKSFSLFFGPSYESVIATNPVTLGGSGSPIIGDNGRWISIVTYPYVEEIVPGFSGGPAQYLAEHVIKSITCYKSGSLPKNLIEINNINGNYFEYRKAFIGIAWSNYFVGNWSQGSEYRKTQGIIVRGVDQSSSFYTLFNSIIGTSDILITEVDGLPIGDLPGQYGLSDITWFKLPGDKIKITYRLGEEKFSKSHDACEKLVEYPAYLNRPSVTTIASYHIETPSTDIKSTGTLPTSTDIVEDSGVKTSGTVTIVPDKTSDGAKGKINGKDYPPMWS